MKTTTSDPAPKLLTVAQVADRIGVSHDTVTRLIAAGDLPALNVSTGSRPRLRVTETALNAFYAARAI